MFCTRRILRVTPNIYRVWSKQSYSIMSSQKTKVATDEYTIVQNMKMKEKMDREMNEHIRKKEEEWKKLSTSALYQAFVKEFGEIEDSLWTKFHLSGIPVTQDNLEYVRQQVQVRREQMKQKYEHMARVYNQRNNTDAKTKQPTIPKHQTQKIERELDRVLSGVKQGGDLDFAGLKQLFAEHSGISPQDVNKETTKEEISEFMKMIKSSDGQKLQNQVNSVLTDDKLEELGIDPKLYNPNLVDQNELQRELQAEQNGVDLQDMDQLKSQIEKELKERPELAEMIKQMGGDVNELLAKREHDIKSGKFAEFRRRSDYTDVVMKLNQDRLKKIEKDQIFNLK